SQPSAPAAAAADLAGDYGVSIAYGGQPLEITLSLARKDDGTMAGSIYVEQAGTIPFNTVNVDGKHVTASLSSPDGANVTMDFTIDAGTLTGNWSSSAGDGSAMRGKKIQ
ncbi:MAG TPA: hypothetical protein VG916_14535, partial [Gemmatimonadaceae bacterium]|nr:hypothetical protein [Gemmatimonadaceae bacterium]